MYKILETKNNVTSYLSLNDKLILVFKENSALYLNADFIAKNVSKNSYTFLDEILYVIGRTTYLGVNSIAESPYFRGSENKISDTIIIQQKSVIDVNLDVFTTLALYDISKKTTNKIDRLKNIVYCINLKDLIVFGSKEFIHAYTLPTAQPLWQFSLEDLGTYEDNQSKTKAYQVEQFVGVYKDLLIVRLSNATFLFLECARGKIKKIIHLNTIFPLPKGGTYLDNYNAHLADDRLYWLSNQRLIKIELQDISAQVIKDYFTGPREEQFRFMKNTYFKGHIYFVADYGWQFVTPSRVGVMDATSGEVLWQQQLEKTGGIAEAPQVTDDKLYVRTVNNVLYIFEKE